MTLFEQISKDIMMAMKAKDKVRLEALRNIKKAFIEAKTATGAGDDLKDDVAMRILQKLSKQGKDVATIYESKGRADLAIAEMAQVKVIEDYLPQVASEEEIETKLKEIISTLGAQGMKDMGKVMAQANSIFVGRADGGTISIIAKKLLS